MKRADVQAWLDARTRADDGCLLWVQTVNSAGTPVASVDGKRARNVRRWLHEQLVGPLDSAERVVPRCRHARCVAPRHFAVLLPGQVNTLSVAEGRWQTAARLASQQRNGRACSKFSMSTAELARQLHAQGQTLREISAVTGMAISTASRVCRGERWAPTAAAASVFNLRCVVAAERSTP